MTSWSRLIEKIQGLCHVFEEDLANSCCQLSEQPTALLSDEATIAALSPQPVTQQLNCDVADVDETVEARSKPLKSSSRSTVLAGEDLSTPVEPLALQLQPVKPKSDHQLQKKYKYVNKKFIVCKETRKDERCIKLIGKKTCEESTLNDPFEFVGTQKTPTSSAEPRDKRSSVMQMKLFEETSVDELTEMQQPVDIKHAPVQRKCGRQQHRLMESGLKQLAEDIADAETYSLIISQQSLRNVKQTADVVNGSRYHNVNETCDDESEAVIETDEDVCMPDSDLVNVGLNAEHDEKEAEHEVLWRAAEKQCNANAAAPSDLDISVKLIVEAKQSHAAHIPSTCSATVSREMPEACLVRSGDASDTECQVHASQRMLCSASVTRAVNVDSDDVSHAVTSTVVTLADNVSSDDVSRAVINTSSDVSVTHSTVITNTGLNGMQYNTSHGEVVAVASVSPSNTLHHDLRDGHISLPAISIDGGNRIDVKRSRKRRRKAQRKKHTNKNACYASEGSRKMKLKAARLIASDIEDDSSGLF